MHNIRSYEAILNLPHHISSRHPQMPLQSRAAQFSPFAALTGFDGEIGETARQTEQKRELTEDEADALNQTFQKLLEMASERPLVSVTYFQPDERKDGGAYVTETGHFRFLDMAEGKIKFAEGNAIPVAEVCRMKIFHR